MPRPIPASYDAVSKLDDDVRLEQERAALRTQHAYQRDANRRTQTHRATHPIFERLRRSIIAGDFALQAASSLPEIDAAVAALEADFNGAVSDLRTGAAAVLGKET